MYNNSLGSLYNQTGGSGFTSVVNFITLYIKYLLLGCIGSCFVNIIIDYYQTRSTITITNKIDDVNTISKGDLKKIDLYTILYLNTLPSIIGLCIWAFILFLALQYNPTK